MAYGEGRWQSQLAELCTVVGCHSEKANMSELDGYVRVNLPTPRSQLAGSRYTDLWHSPSRRYTPEVHTHLRG